MRCIGCRANRLCEWKIFTCEPYRAGGSNPNTLVQVVELESAHISLHHCIEVRNELKSASFASLEQI